MASSQVMPVLIAWVEATLPKASSENAIFCSSFIGLGFVVVWSFAGLLLRLEVAEAPGFFCFDGLAVGFGVRIEEVV